MTIFEITYKDGEVVTYSYDHQYQIDIVLKFIEANDDIINVRRVQL